MFKSLIICVSVFLMCSNALAQVSCSLNGKFLDSQISIVNMPTAVGKFVHISNTGEILSSTSEENKFQDSLALQVVASSPDNNLQILNVYYVKSMQTANAPTFLAGALSEGSNLLQTMFRNPSAANKEMKIEYFNLSCENDKYVEE